MELYQIKFKMSTLRQQAFNNINNARALSKRGYEPTCTNLQLIRGVCRLSEQTYLREIASEIVVELVIKYDSATEEIINSL